MSFLTKWNPWQELERLNRLYGDTPAKGGVSEMAASDWAPRVDIKETNEEFIVHAELPGVKKDDVSVTFKDGILTLKGERLQEREEKGTKYRRVERHYGAFRRTFALPESVDETKLLAEYKDGMLDIHMPKAPAEKHRTVDVKIR